VVLVDGTLSPLLAAILPHLERVHTVVVTGGGGPDAPAEGRRERRGLRGLPPGTP
jgi:hypothetical protein